MKVVDGYPGTRRPSTTARYLGPPPLRRGPVLVTAAFAALGGALIPAASVAGLWRLWQFYAMLFALFAVVEFIAFVAVFGWPTRKTAHAAAVTAAAGLALWVASRPLGLLTRLDPWQPADTVLGFTDYLAAALQVIAVFGFLVVARRGAHPRPSAPRRVAAWIVLFPVLLLVLAAGTAGTIAAGDRITSPAASTLLDGSTVEYCRADGIPLEMDLTRPAARGAPVALFLHGGGLIAGNRRPTGPGALLAGSRLGPLRDALTARGFAVAAIDYRLAPAARWPAPLDDARCAVRFLEAHAAELDLDPARITAVGTGAGGTLASLLGVAGTPEVRAVAAIDAPAEFDLAGQDPLTRASVLAALGRSPATLREASPLTYPGTGAPPFLIVGGRKSAEFADRLRTAGVPVTTGGGDPAEVAQFLATATGTLTP
ncbi:MULTISPECIES: alpha/beta hydrolase [unclassified Amycolatopsis]|uniref:alpha/beta hydrolase n=1 Tax=unclassified Amycolatopsis TaxID=2618356 RepID=UPI00287435EE|nr:MULTISPECIES: alpha/beta hydrolase [unclassified Amycolatopsis]MDS0138795.1 alpha/beta hydrolase [Amycolatopsis sp. 505]MDS0147289.1 alpha/beta hydrolase [Amycolatopsis sp. CM201R]